MSDVPHGKRHHYRNGCRCEPCIEANRRYLRAWREKNRQLRVTDQKTGRFIAAVRGDEHGRISTYTNLLCRCQRCREAARLCSVRRRLRRLESRIMVNGQWFAPAAPQHGLMWTYNEWGCRCAECRAVASAYWKAQREAKEASR